MCHPLRHLCAAGGLNEGSQTAAKTGAVSSAEEERQGRKRPSADAASAQEDLRRSQRARRAPKRSLSPIPKRLARRASKASELAASIAQTPKRANADAPAPIAEQLSAAPPNTHEERPSTEEPGWALNVSTAMGDKPDMAASVAIEPTRRSTRLAGSAAQVTASPQAALREVVEAGDAALITASAPMSGTACASAISVSAAAATPASEGRTAGKRESPAVVPDSVPSRRQRSRAPAEGTAPAAALQALRRSARAAVKSPGASAPGQAPAQRPRRNTGEVVHPPSLLQTVPGSVPAPVPKQAPRRSAHAALRRPSTPVPEREPAEHTSHDAAAPESQTLPEPASARVQRSRRRTGGAAEGLVQTATRPVRRSEVAAALQAAVTPEAPAKRSRRSAVRAAEDIAQRPVSPVKCSSATVTAVTAEAPAKGSGHTAISEEQSAPAPQPVPDAVPARMQRSRRAAGELTGSLAPGSVECRIAAATVQANDTAEPPTQRSTQAGVTCEAGQIEVPTPAHAPGRQCAWAAPKPQTLDATAQAAASAAAGSSPAAAGLSSALPHSSVAKPAVVLGCSKCRRAPKGCKKCRVGPQQAMQRQATDAQPARLVKRGAALATQPQHETVDQAVPESEQCARQPGTDTTQVSNPSLRPCP